MSEDTGIMMSAWQSLVGVWESHDSTSHGLGAGWRYGPLYALARRRILAPEPLDPAENWHFWTAPASPLTTWWLRHWPPRALRRPLVAEILRQDHGIGIRAHYDVGNAFYRLFLDRELLLYSCAAFAGPDDTLEVAQQRKAALLLRLLDPPRGGTVLELGCGWGGMLRLVAAATGAPDRVHGFTLSRNQLRYVREQLGLGASETNFITHAYAPESLDRILAIGSFEHVRPAEIGPLMQRLYTALRPGGRLVAQFFALQPEQFPATMIALQHFFPGSVLAPLPTHLQAAAAAGFRLVHHSTDDYRPTLAAWHERFAANLDEALRLTDVTTVNRYLVFFPISWRFFDQRDAILYRLAWEKPA